jgi:hypothetical protein
MFIYYSNYASMILYMAIKIMFNSYFLLSESNIPLTKVFKNHLDPILGKL